MYKRLVIALCLTLLAAACGSELDESASSPQAGVWIIDGLFDDGEPVDLQNAQMTVEFDDEATSIRVRTVCNALLGSYTFGANVDAGGSTTSGPASLTIPGTTGNECADEDDELDAMVLRLLESIDGWEKQGERLHLLVGDNAAVILQPVS